MNSLAAIDINHRSASPVDWASVACDLDANGFAIMPKLLSRAECRSVSDTYSEDTHFRSRIVMARHGFGRGEYKYFAYPLPDRIAKLRAELYRDLANIANRWNQNMGIAIRYPASHAIFLDRCHKAGQPRPTPLLLQYVAGDYNCLHQDLYGKHVFPFQVAILLSEPDRDFEGGEFVLIEQCREGSHARLSFLCGKAMRWCLPYIIDQFAERVAGTELICATA